MSLCRMRKRGEGSAAVRFLPVRQHKDRIVDKVQLNRVTLIIASTGSGKSSQVPQMLLEEGLMPLLCTQPRRLAVVAISKLVAQERGCPLGDEVGYHIGHKKLASPRSKLVFQTSGVLLEELRGEGNRVLSRYKVIILDEVHERSVESDLVLTCLKQLMQKSAHIRLVLMSATYDCQVYKDYFKDVFRGESVEIIPVSDTLGNMHPKKFKIEESYLEDVLKLLGRDTTDLEYAEKLGWPTDFKKGLQRLIADLITHLHQNEADLSKDMLVFLPTYKALQQQWTYLKESGLDIRIFVLHSSIDMNRSVKAMEVSLSVRKVILATNVAESSVTIPGVAYIIDSCRSLEIFWDNQTKKCVPRLVSVSKSQAEQRKGRTGRTCDGEVFRMVPRATYHKLATFENPAIQLLSLREQVLAICCAESKAMNDPEMLLSKAMDPPDPLTVHNAFTTLRGVGAVVPSLQRGKYLPSPYGRLLASLPLSLASAILVVKGGQLGLLRETALLAALLDANPFPIVHPFGHETQYQMHLQRYYQRQGYLHAEAGEFSYVSVLLANLYAFEFWQCTFMDKQRLERLLYYATHSIVPCYNDTEGEEIWCAQHFLSVSALHTVAEISATILERLHLLRPNFLGCLQGPPSYYSAYKFEHKCDIHPDEDNIMGNIILLESNSGVCLNDKYVTRGQFHPQKDINDLRSLVGQIRNDLLQGKHWVDDDEDEDDNFYLEASPVCRFFLRGACIKGSECKYAHDSTARRPSLCRYFMTPAGCRYGELCEFRHVGTNQYAPIKDVPVEFEGYSRSADEFLQLLPCSDQYHILVCEDHDFSFTEKLSNYYKPDKIVVTISSTERKLTVGRPHVKRQLEQLLSMGVKIAWDLTLGSFMQNSLVIPWNQIGSVLWTIGRENIDEIAAAKCMLHFFYSMSLSLLTRNITKITVLLTMCNDHYAKYQVERIARDCFFFPIQSVPFDMTTFGVYKPIRNTGMPIGEPKPVTYVLQLLPPSATQHGDYIGHLKHTVEARTK